MSSGKRTQQTLRGGPTSRRATAEPLVEPEPRPDLRSVDDLAMAEVIPLPPSGAEPNLLHFKPLNAFLRSRWYPLAFQVASLLVFAFVMIETLFGPEAVHDNAGSAIVWILWWPLLPLTYFVVARSGAPCAPFPSWETSFSALGVGGSRCRSF